MFGLTLMVYRAFSPLNCYTPVAKHTEVTAIIPPGWQLVGVTLVTRFHDTGWFIN